MPSLGGEGGRLLSLVWRQGCPLAPNSMQSWALASSTRWELPEGRGPCCPNTWVEDSHVIPQPAPPPKAQLWCRARHSGPGQEEAPRQCYLHNHLHGRQRRCYVLWVWGADGNWHTACVQATVKSCDKVYSYTRRK